MAATDTSPEPSGEASPLRTPSTPYPLAPRGKPSPPLRFRQGARPPFGVRWYGITSLYGHFRNFIARAIASEQVDSRDWMRPQDPDAMLRHTIRILGGREDAPSLVAALGRAVWIDFVADTGDDRDISLAVGRMLARSYTVDHDGAPRTLPRGDVLLFGGDIAYPVATADEIYRRLVAPWNEAFREVEPSRAGAPVPRRVLLGVPGNHDWYDGLDGFGRLFRRRVGEPFRHEHAGEKQIRILRRLERSQARKVGLVARQLHLDEVGGLLGLLMSFGRSIRAFFKGTGVRRRKRLLLRGYEPVQEASYFAMALAPGLDMWGVDRQLSRLDFRQRAFFKGLRQSSPGNRLLFVASDPALTYGEAHDAGAKNLSACKVSFHRDEVLYLTGDFHHYERRELGRSKHVIAGGGGAFLHGTRMAPLRDVPPAECAYPDAHESRRLAAQAPLKLMLGQAGLLVHLALALVASLELAAASRSLIALITTTASVTLALVVSLYFIAGHHRAHPKEIAAASVPFAVTLGVMPTLLKLALPQIVPSFAGNGGVMIVYAFVGSFLFGVFLWWVAIIGLEPQQAFTVLGHPGYKHFVRMCVHPDGRLEAWTIGKDDPLADAPPTIVDRFDWSPSADG